MALWLTMLALKLMLKPEKRERRYFAYNQLYYYVTRSLSELGSMPPTGVVKETLRMTQNVSATLSTVNNLFNALNATADPYSYAIFTDDTLIKSGKQ